MQYRDNPIMAYWDIDTHGVKKLVCRICIYRSLLTREEDNNIGIHNHLCREGLPLHHINRKCCSRHPYPGRQRYIKPMFKFNNKIHEIATTWNECQICDTCNPECLSKMKIYQNLYRQVIDQTLRDKE